MSVLRAIATLSRPSLLPGVWSNCLAGWWLGGGGHSDVVPVLLAGVTLIFLGGCFLNDAFDAEFDQQHQPDRPIPSGVVSRKAVWTWGIGFLVAGALLCVWQRPATAVAGLVLVATVILFNALHRWFALTPLVWGFCRLLLYLLGASVAVRGLTGWAIWSGLAAGCYAAGAAWLPRLQPKSNPALPWPAALLGVPVALALILNSGGYREAALILSLVLVLWVVRSLRQGIWTRPQEPARSAPGLLAGIIVADWLAVAHAPRELHFVLIALLLATLALQAAAPRLGPAAGPSPASRA
ncbi:MAG TPA: UbiA family prenyltransferase [Verrucomicrobiota bacterium]|nr:UbiA family prenyltransferase [Verrucomicrobiota bacterium]